MKWSPAAVAANASDDEPAYDEPAYDEPAYDKPAYAVAEKAPDTARVGHRSYPPLTKPAASASGEANAEIDADHFGRRGNGAAATRTPPRLPIGARTTPMTERSKSAALNSMWPKGPRPARVTEPQHTTEQAADDTSAHTVQNTAQSPMQNLVSPPASVYDEPVPISVLRSALSMAWPIRSIRTVRSKRNYRGDIALRLDHRIAPTSRAGRLESIAQRFEFREPRRPRVAFSISSPELVKLIVTRRAPTPHGHPSGCAQPLSESHSSAAGSDVPANPYSRTA
jgi:hypothetical protein